MTHTQTESDCCTVRTVVTEPHRGIIIAGWTKIHDEHIVNDEADQDLGFVIL